MNIVIQVISEKYSRNPARLKTFTVKEYEPKVVVPEDLIANRLYTAKVWKNRTQLDLEQATVLLKLFPDSMDNAYLDKLAKRHDTVDILAEARNYASKI